MGTDSDRRDDEVSGVCGRFLLLALVFSGKGSMLIN